jgi:hypothetical protein
LRFKKFSSVWMASISLKQNKIYHKYDRALLFFSTNQPCLLGELEGAWNDAAGPNKYQYNGKEWNDDFGLEPVGDL